MNAESEENDPSPVISVTTGRALTSTERARRFRQRSKAGILLVPIEILPNEIDALIRGGLVTAAHRRDMDAVGSAVLDVLGMWMKKMRK